jgi:hypothetical protein
MRSNLWIQLNLGHSDGSTIDVESTYNTILANHDAINGRDYSLCPTPAGCCIDEFSSFGDNDNVEH